MIALFCVNVSRSHQGVGGQHALARLYRRKQNRFKQPASELGLPISTAGGWSQGRPESG